MIVWHAAASGSDTFHALIKQNIASEFISRLSKFVMRAKVVVRPGNAQVIGATMAATDAARKSLAETGMATVSTGARGLSANQLPSSAKPYDIVRSDPGTWIAAPCANPAIQLGHASCRERMCHNVSI